MRSLFIVLSIICSLNGVAQNTNDEYRWKISIIPASLRLDPVKNEIIENRFTVNKGTLPATLIQKNWIYDGSKASLKAARGEYISFQLVLTNEGSKPLRNIKVEMTPFSSGKSLPKPELFLEWSVNVQTPSTGYPKASLGEGWYPDALIPFEFIQDDSSEVHGRWTYPLWLPDFNNRIPGQKSMLVWVDQFVPFSAAEAPAGRYNSEVTVTIEGQQKKIPVEMQVWNFTLPNENLLKGSLQEEGFLSRMDEERELEMYQLFKRNRVGLMDPTYDPKVTASGKLDWTSFDKRLKKYFTGEAFTNKYGYTNGPGYGEPIETFVLPFDVFGKHGTKGWPDVGTPDVERQPANRAKYESVVKEVRNHMKGMVNPAKTELTVYLNGLDESYFQSALERMVYYGDMFKKLYPEARFRIDGGFNEEAMAFVGSHITSWASHSINYNVDRMKKYQQMGIKDWLYGPMLYESKVNSWVGSLTFLDLPVLNDRAISWSCWKYGTYSWISWGVGVGGKGGWYDPETWKDQYKGGADSDAEFTYKKLNGSALMVYAPGIIPNVTAPCPSIRLKSLRDGVQEYEYMRLLKNADKNDNRVNEIVNRIIGEPFGDKAIGRLDVWSFDPQKWDEARLQMGEMIEKSE